MDALHVPGMAVVVVRDTGIVRLETLGLRDAMRGLPVTPDTRFYIASCTKPMTATLATLLEAEGALDLDDPVRGRLPWFRLADSGLADSLTLRDLLAHRYGLVSRPISFGEAFSGQMTPERYARLLAGVQPRRRFSYSNLHYTLAGRVVEAVTGTSWKAGLERRLFAPAGMSRTTCSARLWNEDPDGARGHAFQDGRWAPSVPDKTDATMHAAGGVVSTPRDLARWLRLQLGDGILDGRRIVPASALRATREPVALDAAEGHPLFPQVRRAAWAPGWEVRMLRGDTLYAHNGEFPGVGAFMAFLPARNLGVAVVTNGPGIALAEMAGLEAIEAAIGEPGDDPLSKVLAMAASRAPATTSPSDGGRLTRSVSSYAGRYGNETWGDLDLSQKSGSVTARIGDMPLSLALTGPDRFTADGDRLGAFELDARGRVSAVWIAMTRGDSARFVRR
jgi:CubicO group peptidase (beta-lactamase class C family)